LTVIGYIVRYYLGLSRFTEHIAALLEVVFL
jgi:hypothetical protein